jgi:hypothetical protein
MAGWYWGAPPGAPGICGKPALGSGITWLGTNGTPGGACPCMPWLFVGWLKEEGFMNLYIVTVMRHTP